MGSSTILLPNSVFHNPILDIIDENKARIIKHLTQDFILTKETLSRLKSVFIKEMDLGLAEAPARKSCLLMQNTFVPEFPDGSESGHYLSLDLGTTNFRVLLSQLGERVADNDFTVKYYDIPDDCRRGSSKNLFNFLAISIEDFVGQVLPNYDKRLALGFTFSFPMTMKSLNIGILETWTKNFDCPDAVGVDCARLLQEAIDSRPSLAVDVVAILNDSTGTLVKGVYLDGDCAVGMILGTGHNMCYIESVGRIGKWTDRSESVYEDVLEVAVNIESGAFGDNGDETKGKVFAEKLTQRLGYAMVTTDDIAIIRYTCAMVTVRATQLISAALATLIDRIDSKRVTVAIDGSLYKKHPKFHRLMTDFTRELLDSKKSFKLILAEDGSGKGAGLVAAIAHRFWAKHNNNHL
ncbi:unnamed protein product [Oppiella nova]|uniref:Phosphotransferase n=1 Tax=Oppiella nova TaxID=334625 RepID=A0A7R9LX96_9ACAR|nr:unnamed protein product [Oppiella nova]CAG2167175.1 unnamed protein product [Oppiella nova]